MPHIHETVDLTAEVFIVFNHRVLLRKHDKYKIWLSIGGHVELDEDPNQAAVREVKEEVGLDVELVGHKLKVKEEGDNYRELIPPRFMNRHTISNTHQHVTCVYFAKSLSDEVTNDSDEKSDELKWFSLADVNDPKFQLRDSVRQYAETALKEVQ